MKCITYVDANLFKISDFKLKKFKDYEFTVCLDEYVQVFVKVVGDRFNADSDPNAKFAASAYFGPNHPL